MSSIYTLKSGLASDTTVWSGGVVPVSGDRVLILHDVELDGAYEWGDDSTATVTINAISTTASITLRDGSIRASRTVNSSLTCNGAFKNEAAGATVYGFYDAGTEADPIPLSVSHSLIVNKSAAMAIGKYLVSTITPGSMTPRWSFHGHYRKRNANLVSLAGDKLSAVLDDVTGWQAGDLIVFAPTAAWDSYDERTILTINTGTKTITFAALNYAHAVGSPVGNFSSNVTIMPYANSSPAATIINPGTTSGTNNTTGFGHIQNTLILGTGGTAFGANGALVAGRSGFNPSSASKVFDPIKSNAFYQGSTGYANSGATGLVVGGNSEVHQLDDNAFFTKVSNSNFSVYSTFRGDSAEYNVFYYNPNASVGGGEVVLNASYVGNFKAKFFGAQYPTYCTATLIGLRLDSPVFGPMSAVSAGANIWTNTAATLSGWTISNGDFGYTFGRGSVVNVVNANSISSLGIRFKDCKFAAGYTSMFRNQLLSYDSEVIFENKNLDPLNQETYTSAGNIFRDTTFSKDVSGSSLKMVPLSAASNLTFDLQVFAPNNKPIVVSGYLYLDPTYDGAAPVVTLSGLSLSNSWTGTIATGVWQQFVVALTQTSGADAMMTVTIACNGTAGAMWCDGVSAPTPVAVNTGEFGYWFGGLPANVIAANYVAAIDVWNVQTNQLTLSGSIGEKLSVPAITANVVQMNGASVTGTGIETDKWRGGV
jgi:hypothetical protein